MPLSELKMQDMESRYTGQKMMNKETNADSNKTLWIRERHDAVRLPQRVVACSRRASFRIGMGVWRAWVRRVARSVGESQSEKWIEYFILFFLISLEQLSQHACSRKLGLQIFHWSSYDTQSKCQTVVSEKMVYGCPEYRLTHKVYYSLQPCKEACFAW